MYFTLPGIYHTFKLYSVLFSYMIIYHISSVYGKCYINFELQMLDIMHFLKIKAKTYSHLLVLSPSIIRWGNLNSQLIVTTCVDFLVLLYCCRCTESWSPSHSSISGVLIGVCGLHDCMSSSIDSFYQYDNNFRPTSKTENFEVINCEFS